MLGELPLTSTGKIDRVCLERRNVEAEAGSAPQTVTERQLAGIWSSVLDVSEIRLHDNFLDLGGNSLLGMQCVSRVRSEFGVDVPLELLIGEESELRTVAAFIERVKRDVQDPDMDVA
jgi:acyl carrier protein